MGRGEATGPGAKVIQRIIFKPQARSDVAEAYEWYEQRDPGLGAEFMRAVDSCYTREIQNALPRCRGACPHAHTLRLGTAAATLPK